MVLEILDDKRMDGAEEGNVVKITAAEVLGNPDGSGCVEGIAVGTGEVYFTTLVYRFFNICGGCVLGSSTPKVEAGVKLIEVSFSLSLLLCLMYLRGQSGSRVSTMAWFSLITLSIRC